MKPRIVTSAAAILVAMSFLMACGSDLDRPDKALIITGVEELAGAPVSLDGVTLGSLELLKKPPGLLLWAVSRITGNESLDSDHETVALIFDLDGTDPGDHLIVINHPAYQPIEKSFNYPEDMTMNSEKPEVGVVFLVGTKFDLIQASSAE